MNTQQHAQQVQHNENLQIQNNHQPTSLNSISVSNASIVSSVNSQQNNMRSIMNNNQLGTSVNHNQGIEVIA